jgi:GTP-binding protein HflX
VALVGYTNAGKSTLFNALTNAAVLESPRMFATLDPTLRSVTLPSKRKVLLSDTVGFIRNLPHTLVSSFRATLEEVQRAALILRVSDASSPLSSEQDAQVDRVLKELEAGDKPTLHIKNKIDLLPPKQRDSLRDDEQTVHVSAVKEIGLGTLVDRIDGLLSEDRLSRVRLRVPQKEGKALALLEARSRIYSRKYKDGLVELEAEVPASLGRRLEQWLVP